MSTKERHPTTEAVSDITDFRLLNQPQLAKVLGVSINLIRDLTARKAIPTLYISSGTNPKTGQPTKPMPRYEPQAVMDALRKSHGANYPADETED